jgi:hypothetical protein
MMRPSTTETSRALRRESLELQKSLRAVSARTQQLTEAAWEARLRAQAARDWAQTVRRDRHRRPTWLDPHPVQWFSLEGELGEEWVWARWRNGVLTCADRLRTQATLAVDLGTVFVNDDPPARVPATLSGPPAAVMLTLAQVCDKVTGIDYELVEGR